MRVKDPRSVSPRPETWLTDSRIYDLIWLGRYLERVDGVMRATESAVLTSHRDATLSDALAVMLAAWRGGPISGSLDTGETLSAVGEMIRDCFAAARDNAEHVGPLELIQGLNELIDEFPDLWTPAQDATDILASCGRMRERLYRLTDIMERRWFSGA